jgi:hypothetical protein
VESVDELHKEVANELSMFETVMLISLHLQTQHKSKSVDKLHKKLQTNYPCCLKQSC